MIEQVVNRQKAHYKTGVTIELAHRIRALKRLRREIIEQKQDIDLALKEDLGRSSFENYMVETGFVLNELNKTIKSLPKWVKPKKVKTPMTSFPGKSKIEYDPYGVCLIMSPWNYPFQLSIVPLIGAIAAGNCAILKPSAYAPATSKIIKDIIYSCFDPEFITVVEGGRDENQELLDQNFDFAFFTGSIKVGKIVMEKCSKHLTPVCLELGGKSPVVVDETIDISLAARRTAFGKFLNAGQTCVAPDYILVQEDVKDKLVSELKRYIQAWFGEEPLSSSEYPKIINGKHLERLKGLISGQDILLGGKDDGVRIEPTIINNPDKKSKLMQEEIFGPILPVIPYSNLDQAISYINGKDKPLALYLFTNDTDTETKVLKECSFGGGCINDTVMHLNSHHLPFGGVGESGIGNYHGKHSFNTFSHSKGILKRGLWPDIPLRYHPHSNNKRKFLQLLWE